MADGRPEAGFGDERFDLVGVEARGVGVGLVVLEGGEVLVAGQIFLLGFVEFDDEGEEFPLFAAVDGDDFAGAGGCEADADALSIFEEQLAALDFIAFRDVHAGFHGGVVMSQQADLGDGRRC